MVVNIVLNLVIQVKYIEMKKYILILFLLSNIVNFISCTSDDTEELSEWRCGTHNEHQLWTGPRGGCYYYNSNGNKTYVDRSECNC